MSTPKEFLVDVRTPAEFATGALANDLYSAINIEYQLINQLPQYYSALGINVEKADHITLYCRSGRRSNIALQTLQGLGYGSVRDIGGLEEARALLMKEQLGRSTGADEKVAVLREKKDGEKKEAIVRSFGALLEGLKGLDDTEVKA